MNPEAIRTKTHHFRNYFLTGLVLLLPIALTVIIVSFLFNLLTHPFEGMMTSFLHSIGIFEGGLWFISEGQLVYWTSKFLILLLLFAITLFLGAVARYFFFNWLLKMGEALVNRIPLIGTIYKTCQDVIQTIFTSQTKSFKQVVLAPYPSKGTLALGLITKEEVTTHDKELLGERVSVFIPTTPNPTSGFLLLYEKKDLIYLDMAIEDALKFVISCGVIFSPIRPMAQPDDKKPE